MKSAVQIVNEIMQYMQQSGSTARDWYVGITNDAKRRLFGEHGVQERNDPWIFRTALNDSQARIAEDHFINRVGTDGGTGGGGSDCTVVYAYRKRQWTSP
jgi:hypothetical protein